MSAAVPTVPHQMPTEPQYSPLHLPTYPAGPTTCSNNIQTLPRLLLLARTHFAPIETYYLLLYIALILCTLCINKSQFLFNLNRKWRLVFLFLDLFYFLESVQLICYNLNLITNLGHPGRTTLLDLRTVYSSYTLEWTECIRYLVRKAVEDFS